MEFVLSAVSVSLRVAWSLLSACSVGMPLCFNGYCTERAHELVTVLGALRARFSERFGLAGSSGPAKVRRSHGTGVSCSWVEGVQERVREFHSATQFGFDAPCFAHVAYALSRYSAPASASESPWATACHDVLQDNTSM